MKTLFIFIILLIGYASPALADYERNKAVPVDEVLFGKIVSVRNITETELVEDRNHGWKVFGGALIGGAVGNQFGSGGGRVLTTILGSMLGGSIADKTHAQSQRVTLELVELMIATDDGDKYMVVQDLDSSMLFHSQDKIRMIYLSDGSVRVDKQM